IGLRHRETRHDRQGSARGQMQKLSAGKFHLNLPLASDHSITSSARARSVAGTVMPSALAVFILMTSWKRVGCSTGKSAGWAPLRILSTYTAALRKRSAYIAEYDISPPSSANQIGR